MKLHELIQRATEDPEFAEDLREKASRALEEGPDTEAEIEFLTMFVTDPADLDLIMASPEMRTMLPMFSGLTSVRPLC